DVIARFSVVFEAYSPPVHGVETRQHLDHRAIDRAAIRRRAMRQRRIDHWMAFDVLHDEEWRADDAGILTEQNHFRHRHIAGVKRGHHFVLALDGVRRWKQLAGWFPAKHESRT